MATNTDSVKIKQWKRKMRTKFKLNYKHYKNDSSQCCTECLTQFFNVTSQKYHIPYPIVQGSQDSLKPNPLLTLIKKKQEFQSKIDSIKYNFHISQRNFEVSKQFESYHNMQDVLLTDPDKYFYSNYNWYYTGGNLVIKRIANIDLLFHISSNSELCVAKIHKKDTGWVARQKRAVSNHTSDIFQLDSVTDIEKTFVGVRQKNDILLYDIKLDTNEKVVCELANIQNTDVPFVAMSLNRQSLQNYAAVNGNHNLQIWDLYKLKPVYDYRVPHDSDALEKDFFAQVSYNDKTVAFINRNNFYIFDKRSKGIATKFNFDRSDILDSLDRFVNICPHQNNTSLYYISTFREVLLLDLRHKNVVNKYSHAFKSAPFISDHIYRENKNIFSISSCNKDEKLIIEQNDERYYLPVLLPTITNSFEFNLLNSSNMSLRLKQHMKASTTGMQLWSSDTNSLTVFSSNYLGDIYCHEISKNTVKDITGYNCFQSNEQLTPNQQLDFVDKVVLKDITFNTDSSPPESTNVLKSKRLNDCITHLKKCRKGFSAKICDVWQNMDTDMDVLEDMEDAPVDVTVRNWLNNYCPPEDLQPEPMP